MKHEYLQLPRRNTISLCVPGHASSGEEYSGMALVTRRALGVRSEALEESRK